MVALAVSACTARVTTPVPTQFSLRFRHATVCRQPRLFNIIRAVQKSEVGDDNGDQRSSGYNSSTMYKKLGGAPAIQGVVDEFYKRVFADDEVKGFFEGIDKHRLKNHQVQFMTYAFGGSQEYHGKDMWRAHEKLVREQGLNDHHFDVIVKHLVGALQHFKVPQEDIEAAGKVVETVRDPMFRDPKTKEYLG